MRLILEQQAYCHQPRTWLHFPTEEERDYDTGEDTPLSLGEAAMLLLLRRWEEPEDSSGSQIHLLPTSAQGCSTSECPGALRPREQPASATRVLSRLQKPKI